MLRYAPRDIVSSELHVYYIDPGRLIRSKRSHCNTLQRFCNILQPLDLERRSVPHSITDISFFLRVMCIAPHCNTLHQPATQCNILSLIPFLLVICMATHYNTLQHVAAFSRVSLLPTSTNSPGRYFFSICWCCRFFALHSMSIHMKYNNSSICRLCFFSSTCSFAICITNLLRLSSSHLASPTSGHNLQATAVCSQSRPDHNIQMCTYIDTHTYMYVSIHTIHVPLRICIYIYIYMYKHIYV